VVPFTQTLVGDYNHDQRPDVALMASGDADRYPNNIHILLNLQGVPDGGCKTPAPVGIAVCLPTTQTASNPVKFSFAANSFYPMRKMEVWVDGVKLSETYKVFANDGFQDVKLTLSAGTHNVDLYAIGFDQEGFRKSLKITVK